MCHLLLEEHAEAANLFTVAAEHDPADPRAWLNRARAHGGLGRFAEAEADAHQAGRGLAEIRVRFPKEWPPATADGGVE